MLSPALLLSECNRPGPITDFAESTIELNDGIGIRAVALLGADEWSHSLDGTLNVVKITTKMRERLEQIRLQQVSFSFKTWRL